MKTRAAVVSEKSGKFEVFEVDLAELRDDEVMVRVVGVGGFATRIWSAGTRCIRSASRPCSATRDPA
jgi:hypothetical protein